MERAFALPAPAKLNLFLHVLGRRDDGFHELQTAFVLIDLADYVDVERRDDGVLRRIGDVVGPPEHDLALRAAQRLRQATGTQHGADIRVTKHIPAGAGLGGGSSDAATTLIALNRLWRTGLDRARLAELALELGADVPFFVHGNNAFGEGRGERLTPVALPPARYALIWPQVHVSTKEIFSDPGLTRNTKGTKMADFAARVAADPFLVSEGSTPYANDLEAVAARCYPIVARALEYLRRRPGAVKGAARMTGSGSAVFVPVETGKVAMAAAEAETVEVAEAGLAEQLPPGWEGWMVRSLQEHPLRAW